MIACVLTKQCLKLLLQALDASPTLKWYTQFVEQKRLENDVLEGTMSVLYIVASSLSLSLSLSLSPRK